MWKISWRLLGLITHFVVVLALSIGFLLAPGPNAWNPFDRPYTNIGPTVIHSVRDLSTLTTVEFVEYTTIEKGDRGVLARLRGDRIFMFAVARVGAGVDLATLDERSFEIDATRKRVRLTLPPPQIMYATLDNKATQVYDRDTGIFTKGDKDLESEARRGAEQVLREQALANEILDTARTNAEQTLTAFLRGLGFEEIEVVHAKRAEAS